MEIVKVVAVESIKEVSQLAYKLFPIYYDYINPKHVKDYLDRYQSEDALNHQLNDNFVYYLVKDDDQKSIGYIGLEQLSDKVQLSKLYLDPEKRGKGMGRQLMNWIKDWTKSKSLGQIDLYVMQENKPAIQFYLKEGFEITGEFLEKFDSGEVEYNHIMSYSF